MQTTAQYQDTAGLHGISPRAQRGSFCSVYLVEPGDDGGEGRRRAVDLKGAQIARHSDSQNAIVSHPSFTTATFQSKEWPPGEPAQSEALATSFSHSLLEAPSHTGADRAEGEVSMSGEDEASTNGHNGRALHSTRSSSVMFPRNMSLDLTATMNTKIDNKLRYPRPKSPSISSYVIVGHTGSPSKVPEEDVKLLARLRQRVKLLRLRVQGQRVLVESKREEQCDADEKYMKWIRTHHVAKENPGQVDASKVQALETLWKACQATRDAYGPAADSLLSLEYGLEVEEARLEQVEGRIYGHLDVSQAPSRLTDYLKDSEDAFSEDENHDDSSSRQSRDSQATSQVDYNDYLWRLGNLDLLQERYQGLIIERSMLEEEREKRQRVGLDLDSEDRDFLALFEDTLEPVRKELSEVSADVERLKMLCIERGLIDIHGNPVQTSAGEEESTAEPFKEKLSELPTDNSKPSQHQETSGNNEPDFRVSDSQGSFGPYVNSWLLHKLRSSEIEIFLLACSVAAEVHSMEGLKWEAEAIRLWRRDGTEEVSPENVYGRNDSDFKSLISQYGTTGNAEKSKQNAIASHTPPSP